MSAFTKRLWLPQATLLLILVGIIVRVPVLVSPISEGHRNAQTAALTAHMIEEGTVRLDPIAPWRGDLNARLVLEFPVYNLLVLAVDAVTGLPLDMAGRLVSLILWITSFVLLQFLWRWTLPPPARVWANLLFVLAPLNWYAGAAFMPETLVQLLTIAFISLCLVYTKTQTLGVCITLILVSGLGLMVKFPAFVHLGLFAALVWLDRLGWRSLFRPSFILGALLLAGSLFAWGRYADSVNSLHFDYWTGLRNIEGFIQIHRPRLSVAYFLPLIAYNAILILGIVGVPLALVGFWQTLRLFRTSFVYRVWIYLLASLVVYWVVWSKAAPLQSYYNLPNTVFFAAMFGIGCAWSVDWMKSARLPPATRFAVATVTTLLLVAVSAVCWTHLYQPDRAIMGAAQWIRANTQKEDLIIFQPRHHPAAMDYEHQPLLSHSSGRRTWIWARSTPEEESMRALRTASYVIITHPVEKLGIFELIRQQIKGPAPAPPVALNELHPASLDIVASCRGYSVFSIKPQNNE